MQILLSFKPSLLFGNLVLCFTQARFLKWLANKQYYCYQIFSKLVLFEAFWLALIEWINIKLAKTIIQSSSNINKGNISYCFSIWLREIKKKLNQELACLDLGNEISISSKNNFNSANNIFAGKLPTFLSFQIHAILSYFYS